MPETVLTPWPDWLIVGQEPWDDVERRNQLLVRALADRHPTARHLFAELPARPREIRDWRPPRLRQVGKNIWAIRAIRPLPGGRSEEASDRIEAWQLRRALAQLGMVRPALWTQDPRAAALLDVLPFDRLVYDLTDDWAAFETDAARRTEVERRIEGLGRRAELVLACSGPLEAGARRWSDRVLFLPNAVEGPTHPAPTPRDLQPLPRPLLGYAGTQHTSRLDVELLARAAELRPAWSFVLLGPNHLDPNSSRRLLSLPNVHHLGVRPHAEVRSYIEAWDICLIPHLVTDFTRSLDPLKLYEYLAAGRPVITTPAGIAPDLQSLVTEATDADRLVARAEDVMRDDDRAQVAARRDAVAGATWGARAAELEAALGTSSGPASDGRVTAVVVSFNTQALLERSLATLRKQEGIPLHTIVVDNGSTDGSVTMVRECFPEVELIVLNENAGFGRANNVALRRCTSEFVLLLNSDAFMASGALAAMLATARQHPEAAAVGPRLLNEDGSLQRSAWPFPRAGRLLLEAVGLHLPLRRLGLLEDLGTWAHDEERAVDFLVGASLLIRTRPLKEVEGFDERFWLYGEEADLQRRLSTRGWSVVFTPTAEVMHVAGASSTDDLPRLRHFYAGQRRFLEHHGGPLSWPVGRLALLVGSLLRRRWALARLAWDQFF